ncbi:MAG: hypothetical protein ACXW2C_06370 [Acidimicrobiia bacterium]
MHPIEHLRFVARAHGADPASLVRETAHAMSSMRFDPSGLVVACRRVVERHPECGPLWWLCAHLLTAQEPFRLAWELADAIDDDSTADELASAIPDDAVVVTIGWTDICARALTRRGDVTVLVVESRHRGSSLMQRLERHDVACELVQAEAIGRAIPAADLVILETHATSTERVVAPIGSTAVAAVAATCGVPVWLVAGVGRRLPRDLVVAIDERVAKVDDPWELDTDVFPTACVTHVVGVHGLSVSSPEALAAECPMVPELLRVSPI